MGTSKNFQTVYRVLFLSFILSTILFFAFDGCGTRHKTFRVGILCGLNVFDSTTVGFKSKMTELGYAEGSTITYDIQHTESEPVRENAILQQFIHENVDLVVTCPTIVTVEAKSALQGTDIPLVFANSNIEYIELVKSILEPGKNITGVRYPGPDISLKRFEILMEIIPHAKHVLLPYDRSLGLIANQLEILREASQSAGVTLVELPALDAHELETKIAALASAGSSIDAILMIPEPLAVSHQGFKILATYAAEHKIPIGGAWSCIDGYSTIWSVSTDNIAVGKQAAVLADKILKGTPAGTIPIVSAESYIQINNAAAKKLGIKIPDGLLKQADQVIR